MRWTAAKLIFLGAVVTIAAFAISQLFAWFLAPFQTTENMTAPARRSSARTIPVSTFSPMQFFEADWLMVLSVLFIAGMIWLVRRPPPSDLNGPELVDVCVKLSRGFAEARADVVVDVLADDVRALPELWSAWAWSAAMRKRRLNDGRQAGAVAAGGRGGRRPTP